MIGAATEELDLTAMLATYREQGDRYGHTAASDAERDLDLFAEDLTKRAHECRDVAIRGDRQNLDVAYRRAARLGAYALATMRRIRAEQAVRGAQGAQDLEQQRQQEGGQ